jgi:hypothetical protein
MRTRKLTYYSGLVWPPTEAGPSMKEARRDLDRAFIQLRIGLLSG